MPVFQTPDPIAVAVEIGVGDIRIVASDRADTVVDVRPGDPAKKSDVAAAERTRVEYGAGRLIVRAPKGLKQYTLWGGSESIDVEIALPSGSSVDAEAAVAALRCTGTLGELRYKAGAGEVHVDRAGPVTIKTGAGDITLDCVTEHAAVATSSGETRIRDIDGTAVIKNSNGDTWIGEVTGDVRVHAANGRISVERAHATVAASTAKGDIRLDQVAHGFVVAQTAFGKVDIGIRDGVAAWLDLDTGFGHVESSLEPSGQPEAGAHTVQVRARSGYGDISIRRSSVAAPLRPRR